MSLVVLLLLVLQFLILLVITLAAWSKYGRNIGIVVFLLASLATSILIGLFHQRFVKLVVRDA